MQYCLYLRKSRADLEAESHGDGETLARHEKLLLELAKRGNYNVTQIYREIVSGETLAARPVMQQLLSEVEQGVWTGVLVVEIERLARGDTIDQGIVAQAFKYSNTLIITPTKVYDPNNEFDEEYFEFGLFMSRREYKTINRRLQQGRLAATKEGKCVSGTAPYGYRKKKIPNDKGWTYEIYEEEANVVRLIFDFYINPELSPSGISRHIGVREIGRRLDALGYKTPSGGDQWTGTTIRNILGNPVYIGKIRWYHRKTKKTVENGKVSKKQYLSKPEDEEVFDGLHPAIVSKDIFYKAQEVIHSNPPPIAGTFELANPLAGLVFCQRCGRLMHLNSTSNYVFLRCVTHSCPCPSTQLSFVENRVLEGLAEWLENYKLQWDNGDSSSDLDKSRLDTMEITLKHTQAEVIKIRKMQAKTHELLEQGIYDTDTFLSRSRTLAEQLTAAESAVAACTDELTLEQLRIENQQNIIPKIEKLLEVYETLPSAKAKNDILKEVLEKVVYYREKASVRNGPLDAFEITLFPKLPKI